MSTQYYPTCVYIQAVEDVSRGQIKPADKLYELKALQDGGKKLQVRYSQSSQYFGLDFVHLYWAATLYGMGMAIETE